MRGIILALGLGALAIGGAAWGESAEMRGKFPANVREANYLEAIVVDRFNGRDGGQAQTIIENMVGIPSGRPDGALSGSVTTGVESGRYQGNEDQCVEWKDGKKGSQCLKRARVPVPCQRRIINLTISVRLTRIADNQPLWSDNKELRDETSWCMDRQPQRTTEEAISSMIKTIAEKIRYDVRPVYSTYKVRFREDRDGMPKDLGSQFKDIVKRSNKDVPGACGDWSAFNTRLPNNASVLYNLGVCAEARGAYPEAQNYYGAAQAALGKKNDDMVESGNRIARLLSARAFDDEIARRKRR